MKCLAPNFRYERLHIISVLLGSPVEDLTEEFTLYASQYGKVYECI